MNNWFSDFGNSFNFFIIELFIFKGLSFFLNELIDKPIYN